MLDALGPETMLGYCTNVHRGETLPEIQSNLERYTLKIKEKVCPDTPMGIGLWLPALTAREMIDRDLIAGFRKWLEKNGLMVFTLNGFPFGGFHDAVVKQRVYQPDWYRRERLNYTLDLIKILSGLLDPLATEGSISTLPIGWRTEDNNLLDVAATNLLKAVESMARLEDQTGKLIHVDLEPEPGCTLQASQDVVSFFHDWLDPRGDPARNRRYLRVCHDVCHAAVMFEDQAQALNRYRSDGILVGKIQASSAVAVCFDGLERADRLSALEELRRFQEDRYQHQTVIQLESGATHFYDDLSDALATCTDIPQSQTDSTPPPLPAGQWRVHFHVPLFVERFGYVETTNGSIASCLAMAQSMGVQHYEVETYAWDVLPEIDRQPMDLSDGISRELSWLIESQNRMIERAEQ